MRQEVEAWGQQPGPLPLWLEKPGRTRQEGTARGGSCRQVEVEDADGRLAMAELCCLVVHSSQLADQTAVAYAAAQAKAAERLAEPIRRVEARCLACAPTPRPPAPPMQAVGRDGEAARRTPGALMPSPLGWKL